MTKLYDLTIGLLTEYPALRNSDKKLMWAVWTRLGYATLEMKKEDFYGDKCPTPESITRCRRKIQEKHPELQATEGVRAARAKKEEEKGTFIYREKVQNKDNETL